MKLNTITMRRWMLKGAALCGLINVLHQGIAQMSTVMCLWTGLIVESDHQGYTRKTGPMREGARAFLVLSFTLLIQNLMNVLLEFAGFAHNTWYGVICAFSVPFTAQCLTDRLYSYLFSPAMCIIGGTLFLGMQFLIS